MIHNEDKNQSIQTDQMLTHILELEEKVMKISCYNCFLYSVLKLVKT